jgi:hypothetical protein
MDDVTLWLESIDQLSPSSADGVSLSSVKMNLWKKALTILFEMGEGLF